MRSPYRDRAEQLMLFYFDVTLDDWDSRDGKGIRELVTCLIDAAKDELRAELRTEAMDRRITLADVLDDPTNLAGR